MPFGRYAMLQWLTTLLIVCCFLTNAACGEPSTLHFFPNRWGLPFPFEYTSTIVDANSGEGAIDGLYIDIQVFHGSLDLLLGGFEKCYAEIAESAHILPIVGPEDPDAATNMVGGFVDLTEISTPSQYDIRWVCESLYLRRPASLYGVETGLGTDIDVKVSIYDSSHTLTLLESGHMVTIKDDPTIIHTYSWIKSSLSLFSVSLTFYRPATLHEDTFYITHPMLDIHPITSMHISPDDNLVEDLRRNYHAIRPSQLGDSLFCVADKSIPGTNTDVIASNIYYVDKYGDGVLVPKLVVPSTVPSGEEYTCTVTINAQPGTIAAILASVSLEGAARIQYDIDADSGRSYLVDLPYPRAIPDSSYSTTQITAGIHQWVSSQHFMDSTAEFEIGLAITDRYYDSAEDQMTSYPPLQFERLTFMVSSLSAATANGGGLTGHEIPLAEWSPTIACRDHTTLEYPGDTLLEDGILHLVKEQFSVFGKTCRIRLQKRPQQVPPTGALIIRALNPAEPTDEHPPVSLFPFHPMDAFDSIHGSILYHDTSSVVASELPPPVPIPFTTIEEDGMLYAIAELNFQYLLPYQTTYVTVPSQVSYAPDQMAISLFLADQVAIPSSLQNPSTWLTVTSGNHVIYDDDAALYSIDRGFDPSLFTADAISTIFQHGQSVRSPRLDLAFFMPVLDATRPLRITLKILLSSYIDVSEMQIYPVLMPYIQALTSTYSPMYGMFTAPRATPLTGYSYRCVTWDRMAASYVYGRTAPAVTDENSVPCPSYTLPLSGDVVTELDVNDTTIWRRVEYASTVALAKIMSDYACFYERAAVCVTPSTTVEGAYDTHPLADCPSFLGTTHMIPCNQVDQDNTAIQPSPPPPYSLVLMKPSHITRRSSRRFISIFWNYIGDPHLTMTVAVAITPSDAVEPPLSSSAWIVISRDVPANLSLDGQWLTHLKYTTMVLPFPTMDVVPGNYLHVRLTLNNAPQIEDINTSTLPADNSSSNGDILLNCTEKFHKSIDPSTQLCSCRPGYRSNVPNGIEDPFLHPDAFFCTQRCNQQAGHTWSLVNNRCEDSAGDFQCENYGVKNPSTQRCQCLEGFFGEYCQHTASDKDHLCAQLECVAGHTAMLSGDAQCIPAETAEQGSNGLRCNCLPEYTGEQCQHAKVCGVRQCVNGRLTSPTRKPDQCKCECNSTNITGTACNQCTLGCRNGGVANTRCTACQCPAGYIGSTCTIPVWYHTFTLRNLPQHIVELILGTTASDKQEMAILQQTMVKYLLEDYSRVLSETFIVVDGNAGNGNPDDNDNDTRIRVRVELSQFQTVISPANPNAPYVHIQLMLYPADMTEEMLAYALQHGLDFDWSRVTGNLEFFRKFLREQGIVDDNDDLTPDIDDPGCTTRECRENIIEEESSNHAPASLTLVLTFSLCLLAMFFLFST